MTKDWVRVIGIIGIVAGMEGMLNGKLLGGMIAIIGGASLLRTVNRYIIYVPAPVGLTLLGIGVLMGGAHP